MDAGWQIAGIKLVRPSAEHLSGYVAALERGWNPDNLDAKVPQEQLDKIAADPAAFLDGLDDPEAKGAPIRQPDGSFAPRLPGFVRWIWDGAFCGSIGLRWQPGTSALPASVLGHTGYAVVPWKQRQGCATQALALMLPHAWAEGLQYIEITTDPENVASQRVIQACGGVLVERFQKTAAQGGEWCLRFRIERSE